MGRSSDVYSLPVEYQVSDGDDVLPIQHNTPLEDIEADLNAARPIVAGGTGATTEDGARDNLAINPKVLAKSADYTVTTSDRGKLIYCTASLTLTLPAAATAGDGFVFKVFGEFGSSSTSKVTIDPDGSEMINGESSAEIYTNGGATVVCDGSKWVTLQTPGEYPRFGNVFLTGVGTPQLTLDRNGGDSSRLYVTSGGIVLAMDEASEGNDLFSFSVTYQSAAQFSVSAGGSYILSDLGVGTNSPQSVLHAKEDTAATEALRLESDLGTNTALLDFITPATDSATDPWLLNTGNSFGIQTDGTTRLLIDDGGDVRVEENLLVGGSTVGTSADKVISLHNGTAPTTNTAGAQLFAESGDFKVRDGDGYEMVMRGEISFSVADDAVYTLDLDGVTTGIALLKIHSASGAATSVPVGEFRARAGASPFIENFSLDLTSVTLTTGALTGTTGTDGDFTIAPHTDGNLYLENRTGATRFLTLKKML